MQYTDLERAIIKTISYFDIFRYPLTEMETWKWLWEEKACIEEVSQVLSGLLQKKKIAYKDGLYFLPGNEKYISERREKYIIADKKYKKLKRIIWFLQIVPFVRFIGACNTMQIFDFREESDLDVFIIVEKKRMWTARFIITVLVALLGQWRHGDRIKDKICLSFYITTEKMSLENIALKEDPYLVYWISFIVPLLNRGVYEIFWQENEWIKKYILNAFMFESTQRRIVKQSGFLEDIRYFFERMLGKSFGRRIESFLKRRQIKKMKKKEAESGREKSAIVITDSMLKFHEVDRKSYYKDAWVDIYEKVL